MKKLYFAACTLLTTSFMASAQIGEGGFPWSTSSNWTTATTVQNIVLEKPDYERLQREDLEGDNQTKPYRVGVNVPAAIDIKNAGSWSYLNDGKKVWQLSVTVPEAAAVALFYDQFHLPKGVSLYLRNDNGKQVLGAYTSSINPENGIFSNEPIQGNTVHIEMNVDPSVDVAQIQYRIKYAAGLYRGLDANTLQYALDVDPYNPPGVLGQSAACHINAACPAGANYEDNKTSVARILISPDTTWGNVGFCSGTLINNTGNNGANCRNLFLTASHCDGDNGHDNNHFQYWQFRFNYKSSNCDGTGLPSMTTSPVLTGGAKFVSRSNYPSMPQTGSYPSLVQDFLLLELNDAIPTSLNAHYSGWTRKSSYTATELNDEYYLFLGLHHPGGDMMKVMASTIAAANGTFNQTAVPATHWHISSHIGGKAPGSSGSALFDIYGRVMGALSGGPVATCNLDGKPYGTVGDYSKISYGWENAYDQTNFPTYAGAQSRLKDALDPIGSDALNLGSTLVSNCVNVGIRGLEKLDNNAFKIYPTTSTGATSIQFNLKKASDAYVTVYNSLGQKVHSLNLFKVSTGTYSLDLKNQPSGLYMVTAVIDGLQGSQKLIIAK